MLLFVNACVRRENSRTLRLAKKLLGKLDEQDDQIETIDLTENTISPLTPELLKERESLAMSGDFSGPVFQYARQFAKADTIVIAAPFWDMSFPALLKIYIERICVVGVTFTYTADDQPVGLCKAKKLYFVTTGGGVIPENNFGFMQIKALAEGFFSIPEIICIKADRLDYAGADPGEYLKRAEDEIERLFQ